MVDSSLYIDKQEDFPSIASKEAARIPVTDCDRTYAGPSIYAFYNIVCSVCGVGMLALSQSLSKGGWAAIALIIIAWWMVLYLSIIVNKCLYLPRNRKLHHTRLSSIPAIADDAFGKFGGWIAYFFQTWIFLGASILHFVLAGANMNKLCENTAGEIGVVPWTIIFCIVICIPFIFLKSMSDTGWTSISGALAILITTFICVVVAGVDNNTGLPQRIASGQIAPITHQSFVLSGFPGALANIAVSFGANMMFPSIEAAMRKPKQWPQVVTYALTTCACLYILIAVPGYYVYGDSVKNPVYYSLPDGIPLKICIVLVTLAVLAPIPIFLSAFNLECEEAMNLTVERLGRKREFIFRAIFRSLTIIFCAVVGCTIPFFDLLMGLVGSFGFCTCIFIVPIPCYWRLTGFRNKPIYELAWNILILLFGFVGLIFGTWFAVEDLVHEFQK
ncbi:transmembrane amino acid transporter protein-domain-containing protein [Phascolomyces articulosus]|uniref:Transmembrane amino acid transporter protein-domain-containing protein n=1 Tax=Phascolomyces articulosus TaxID=60185 RepID=A0AAD5JLE8_9FUNG|nr:transmembrane amino acid transporter protein-domain-containing protein [Phascolomyces articulosus]